MNFTEILSFTRTLSREEQLQLAVCLTRTDKTEVQPSASLSFQNLHALKQYRYNNFAYEMLLATV